MDASLPSVRRFPYPYRAMLAICSDLDETPDADTYFELMQFLNTHADTAMGQGVGLEVGNSIYFDMAAGHFSYWNTTDENREKIRILIRSGHIDVLHSYGDLATDRTHAGRALDELEKHNCQLKVWVDHAQAPTNLGADIMLGHGDEPGHLAYHADLSLAHGIQYVWRGRVTSVIGQGVAAEVTRLKLPANPEQSQSLLTSAATSADLGAIWNWNNALTSAGTVAKEAAKQLLARCGNRKYKLHAANSVMAPCRLRDDQQTNEFLRCNPHCGGVSCGDRGDMIHEVLTSRFLNRLIERKGVCILYTHLGKLDRGQDKRRFSPAFVGAFRLLAEYYRSGKILVTTTRRLLDYQRMWQQVQVSTSNDETQLHVSLPTESKLASAPSRCANEHLAGLTTYVSKSERIEVCADGFVSLSYTCNAADETDRESISVSFPRLQFPL